MRKWRILAIAVVVSLGGVTTADAQSVRDVFKRVRDAVVVVHVPGEVGSGVLVDQRGYVLTAAHVVQAAEDVEVEFAGGEKVPAKVVRSEPAADVALIQVSQMPVSPVIAPLADESTALAIRGRRMAGSVLLIEALGGGWHAAALGTPTAAETP